MSKLNILLIAAIIPIAIIVLSGVASASGTATVQSVTFTIDSIHRNGHYIGTPVLISGETEQYGYNYTFVFDGSYTLNGHATNNLGDPVEVSVDAYSYTTHDWEYTTFTVPADTGNPGRADFSVTVISPDTDFDSIGYIGIPKAYDDKSSPNVFIFHVGDEDSIITDAADTTTHTVDEGPMSNTSIIFNNGILNSNASIVYTLNQSGDDYKALYTNGKFDFKSSPLYAFAE